MIAWRITELLMRGFRGTSRRVNGLIVGWRGARLPIGSRVIHPERMQVGGGFRASDAVWIEAVVEYAGRTYAPMIRIGDRFVASRRLHISCVNSISIGDDVLFGSNVFVCDHNHGGYGVDSGREVSEGPDCPPRLRKLCDGLPVVIGDRVWVGDNCVILQGVTVGDGAVIGANSVVVKDVPAGTVAVGAPAVPIKAWNEEARIWERVVVTRQC